MNSFVTGQMSTGQLARIVIVVTGPAGGTTSG
jgi:hypothetical protein